MDSHLPSCSHSQGSILYVEDEEDDIVMLQFALKKARVTNPLKTVKDGEEALAYLNGSGKYGDRSHYPIPAVVLLDLNVPRIPGLQVLQWIREHPQFASLPVVLYTSAEHPAEIERAQRLGASEYMVKPSGLDNMLAAVEKLKQWLPGP